MELQFVTFEQAQALYELGFPQETEELYAVCDYCYDDSDYPTTFNNGDLIEGHCGRFAAKDVIAAPSLELAAKWLREEKEIIFCPTIVRFDDEARYSINGIYKVAGRCICVCWHNLYNTYEQALSAVIDKAIEILKTR